MLNGQAVCVTCGRQFNPDTEFTDLLSAQEFLISGLCQGCQDEVFNLIQEDVSCDYVDVQEKQGVVCPNCDEYHS